MMPRLNWHLDPPSPHKLKKAVKVRPPLTKLSGSAHNDNDVVAIKPASMFKTQTSVNCSKNQVWHGKNNKGANQTVRMRRPACASVIRIQ